MGTIMWGANQSNLKTALARLLIALLLALYSLVKVLQRSVKNQLLILTRRQNRRMFATQAEYRTQVPKRLGLVGFGGVGGVSQSWTDFRSDGLLPAAGFGLRFMLDKKNRINYRIDVRFGREGRTIAIGIGEAF
jgi:hypothetical protein